MDNMDKFLTYTFPNSLLEGTPWNSAWNEKERKEFNGLAILFFGIAAALYIGHYYFFDLPTGLEPREHWFHFRASMTGLCLATVGFYISPLAKNKYYRLPTVVTGLVCCYFQARVSVWYPEAPWLYCFAFIILFTFLLQTSPLKSFVFASIAAAIQYSSLREAAVPLPAIISAFLVIVIMILATRSAYISNIRFFLLTQQNTDSQRKNIELNIDFTDRLKSFIPEQIALRLENRLADGRTTVLQAIDDVLRPKKMKIACLFSDIRGYTESSKNLDDYIGELVLPNIKACTHAVEEYGGIPRKIGDLIFAYYDSDDQFQNVLQSILSGLEIASINENQNADANGSEIRRYILISTGEAIVGNIGGFDSSVEITALGPPVNLLARIDEATKTKALASQLENGDILVCENTYRLIRAKNLRLEVGRIDFEESGIDIRDFAEQKALYSIRTTEYNRQCIEQYYESNPLTKESSSRDTRGQAA